MRTYDGVLEEGDFEAAMEAIGGELAPARTFSPEEALACSLANPESCEACQ